MIRDKIFPRVVCINKKGKKNKHSLVGYIYMKDFYLMTKKNEIINFFKNRWNGKYYTIGDKQGLERQLMHSYSLSYVHPRCKYLGLYT